MSDRMSPRHVPLTALQFFKTWWFLIAALGSMTVAGLTFGIELSLRVQQLSKKQQVDDLQWLNIRANTRQGIDHQRRLLDAEQHITPESIQAWGAVQNTVREDHRSLIEHLRNHP